VVYVVFLIVSRDMTNAPFSLSSKIIFLVK
jgi:hypothetical protein